MANHHAILVVMAAVGSLLASSLLGCSHVEQHVEAFCEPVMCAAGSFANKTHEYASELVEITRSGVAGDNCTDPTSQKCKDAVANMTTTVLTHLLEISLGLEWADAFAKVSDYILDDAVPEMKMQSCELDAVEKFTKGRNITEEKIVKAIEIKKKVDGKLDEFFAAVDKVKPVAKKITETWASIKEHAEYYLGQAVDYALAEIPQSFYDDLGKAAKTAEEDVTDEIAKKMKKYLVKPIMNKLESVCSAQTQDQCEAKAKEKEASNFTLPFTLPSVSLPELVDVDFYGLNFTSTVIDLLSTCLAPGRLIKAIVLGTPCPSAWDIYEAMKPLLAQLVEKLKEHDEIFLKLFPSDVVSLKEDLQTCRTPSSSLVAMLRQVPGALAAILAALAALLAAITFGGVAQRRGSFSLARKPLLSADDY